MTCETLGLLLDEYLADSLSPAIRAEVDSHMQRCAGCRVRAGELSRLDDLLREMPREATPARLPMQIREQVRWHGRPGRIGHALPLAFATFCSLLLFVWLASDTLAALQDRVMWEFMTWLVSVPEVVWRHPAEMLAGFADFAPLSRIFFTSISAVTSWRLMKYLISEFRLSSPQLG